MMARPRDRCAGWIAIVAVMATVGVAVGVAPRARPSPSRVLVVPVPVVVSGSAAVDRRVDVLVARTEYLHQVVVALCKPDGFGARVHPPEPPPGWSALHVDREGPR